MLKEVVFGATELIRHRLRIKQSWLILHRFCLPSRTRYLDLTGTRRGSSILGPVAPLLGFAAMSPGRPVVANQALPICSHDERYNLELRGTYSLT